MPDRLKDKVCIVTGGGAGLGEATSRLFAEEGARVVIADIDSANAERVAGEITRTGGDAIAVVADVAEPEAVKAVSDSCRG